MDKPDDGRHIAVSPNARLELTLRDGVLVARIEGEIDLANVARVERVVMEAIAHDRPRAVLADLEALDYLDGGGRAWLHRLRERLRLCGVGFDVARPAAGAAARLFELLWPIDDGESRPGG